MLHQLGSPLLSMACQQLQGMHEWPGNPPGHVRPVCCCAPVGAASSPRAACIMPEIPACNLPAGSMTASCLLPSLPFPSRADSTVMRELIALSHAGAFSAAEGSGHPMSQHGLPCTCSQPRTQLGVRARDGLVPLSWSCSAGASTPHCWRRSRIGRCQRDVPIDLASICFDDGQSPDRRASAT